MTEKKTTSKAAATKATATKTTAAKKTTVKKTTKKATVFVDADNAGFRAGDVYQALAAADHALSLTEVAEMAKISTEDAILGIGWLLKEGKIKDEDNKVALA